MEKQQEKNKIIIDIGSEFVKAGFSGEEKPEFFFQSKIGKIETNSIMDELNSKKFFKNNLIENKEENIIWENVVERGHVINWDNWEQMISYIFYSEFKVDPLEYPVLVPETMLGTRNFREKSSQILFETFNVPKMSIMIQSVLSLISYQKTTGFVIEIGGGVTYAVPIYENYVLPHAVLRLDIAGYDLTRNLRDILIKDGKIESNEITFEEARNIKEKFCYVSFDPQEDLQALNQPNSFSRDITLDNGRTFSIDQQRFLSVEPLFDPSLIGMNSVGLSHLCSNSILKCDQEIQKDLFKNIVLAGGSSVLDGVETRLIKDLTFLHSDQEIKIFSNPQRDFSCWIGGSIFCSLPNTDFYWATEEEYQESGPSLLMRKI
ncbi:actin epsilon 1 [Anaeramoeba ignava]|uniref:Actin epsilon 1 n=1 Tax=Anaeramoeba ignava TaxID=1746090 RepID=A0A9Q0LE21_ANAIG|nr:actin epsilon 1 [Anaeramoeba ignava]